MRSFIELTEQKGQIVFAFGRFNPPTIGHKKLYDKLASLSDVHFVFVSPTQDSKKNPLTKEQKIRFMDAQFPQMADHVINDPSIRTIIDVMAFSELSKSMEDYEKQYLNATLYYLIKEYDILFYVSPEGVEIEDNGVRETDAEYRMAIDREIRSIIGMYCRKKAITISGTTEERIAQVLYSTGVESYMR